MAPWVGVVMGGGMLKIEPLSRGYLEQVAQISATAPDPWALQELEKAMDTKTRRVYVAVLDGAPVGFCCFFALYDSADLEIIAVHKDYRRKGVAKALLAHAKDELVGMGVRRVLLEVRKSNSAAIAFYASLGCKTLATRQDMYAKPVEDGLLMALSLAQ